MNQVQPTTNGIDPASVQTKVCVECQLPKSTDEFYKDATSAGGRRSECKTCHIRKTLARRAKAGAVSAARSFTDALQGRWRDAFDAIAGQMCAECSGEMALVKAGSGHLCKCVYEKVFDDIMAAYEQSRASAGCRGEITEHHVPGFGGGVSYSRKNQEFVADVDIVVKRVARKLDESVEFHENFPYHSALAKHVILNGLPLSHVLHQLGISVQLDRRARLALDRVAMRAAIEAVEMEPYPLFPLSKYFEESTVVNTVSGHPDHRRSIKIAIQRDSAARAAVTHGLH